MEKTMTREELEHAFSWVSLQILIEAFRQDVTGIEIGIIVHRKDGNDIYRREYFSPKD